jgi:hypothetical protein
VESALEKKYSDILSKQREEFELELKKNLLEKEHEVFTRASAQANVFFFLNFYSG